jgi:hypothetical protein
MNDAEINDIETPPEQYYVARNDAPPRFLGVTEPIVICGEVDSPDTQAIYQRDEKERAFAERDKIREDADNPDINVYRITVEPVDDPRDGETAGERNE